MPTDAPTDAAATGAYDPDEPWLVDDGRPRPVLTVVRWLALAIYLYVMVIEVILLIGFVMLLFGVEPSSWFADWIYRSVDRTMQPFRGIFAAIEFGTGSSEEIEPTIESSIPFAMIVYGIIALAAHDLVEWIGQSRRD